MNSPQMARLDSHSIRIAALITMCVAGVLRAQTTAPLVPGARVRVTVSNALTPPGQEGTVLAVGADSLVLRLQPLGDSVAFPMAQVTKLEVTRGQHSNALKGLGLGALVGVALGAVGGAVSYTPCVSRCFGDLGAGFAVMGGGLVGGVLGGAVGGIIGAAHKSER